MAKVKQYSKQWYLQKAEERLRGGAGWTQNAYKRTVGNETRYCLIGSVTGGGTYRNEGQRQAVEAIEQAIAKLFPKSWESAYADIPEWNDDKRRKPEQVLRVIQKAKTL